MKTALAGTKRAQSPGKCLLRRVPYFCVLTALGTAATQAAEIPISGTYGTVAMCIIDAFTDAPSPQIDYSVGGAPLARVMPSEFDTPNESCAFKRLVSQSLSAAISSWDIEANCTRAAGNVARILTIANDREAGTVTIFAEGGKNLGTLDQCSISYPERLSRELARLPPRSGK